MPRVLASSATFERHEGPKIAGLPNPYRLIRVHLCKETGQLITVNFVDSVCSRRYIDVKREVRIVSDVSVATDLAQQLGHWNEFRSGSGYDVDLYNVYTHEQVQVRYIDGEDEISFVSVVSEQPGCLFDGILGEVIYALSCRDGKLIVKRRN